MLLAVRVTPKSSTNKIRGLHHASDGAVYLQIAVTAQPEKGKANVAVVKTLAAALGCAKSRVGIIAGDTARLKTVLLRTSLAEAEAMLSRLAIE